MVPPAPRPTSTASRTLIGAAALAVLAASAVAYLRCAPLDGSEEVLPATSAEAAPAVAPPDEARSASLPSPLPSARLATGPELPPPPKPGEGLAAFPPPGTKPVKRGIVVPEDFQLPEGYVRHYQATDNGQMLPAVLMFHPDIKPKGPDGRPVQVPADRMVPPELAPPGMPIQMLEVPAGAPE